MNIDIEVPEVRKFLELQDDIQQKGFSQTNLFAVIVYNEDTNKIHVERLLNGVGNIGSSDVELVRSDYDSAYKVRLDLDVPNDVSLSEYFDNMDEVELAEALYELSKDYSQYAT